MNDFKPTTHHNYVHFNNKSAIFFTFDHIIYLCTCLSEQFISFPWLFWLYSIEFNICWLFSVLLRFLSCKLHISHHKHQKRRANPCTIFGKQQKMRIILIFFWKQHTHTHCIFVGARRFYCVRISIELYIPSHTFIHSFNHFFYFMVYVHFLFLHIVHLIVMRQKLWARVEFRLKTSQHSSI